MKINVPLTFSVMNNRLRKLIEFKTSGNQSEFAALMGWTPQYLSRLVLGESGIGIRPVVALLEKFPDLNARWLLLGEGAMVTSGVDKAKQHLLRLLSLEKYMPVMSASELHSLTEDGKTDFSESDIARWEELLSRREYYINSAIQRSQLCKAPTVK